MLTRAVVLGILCIASTNCYYPNGDIGGSIRRSSSHFDWASLPDLFEAESAKIISEERDVEEVTERDREPLAPDFKEPSDKPKDENAPKPASFDPTVVPGGVIDVDAGGFGLPTGFPRFPDAFGFSSSFGSRHPSESDGGLFGLGGFFGPLAESKPWWKGENVCIEREETTDDEDGGIQSKQNNTEIPNFFSTSVSLSNCQQTSSKYECVTKINNHGVVKTFVVRYKCCYGYARADGSAGCTKKINLLPLMATVEDIGGKEFGKMIRSAELQSKFEKENLTVFVPTDAALSEFTDRMIETNQVELNAGSVRRRRQVSVSSKDLILNHVVPGFIDVGELINEEVLLSDNNNSIRYNVYPTRNYGKMITVNCARLHKAHNLATNGIVHLVEGVLNPVTQTVVDIIGEHPRLKSLNKALKNSDLTKNFKVNGHYSVFAPTDEAFDKLAESTKEKLLRGDACAATILKHHIVAHTVCSSAIIGNATTHNVDGDILNLQRTEDDVLLFENSAKIVVTDIVGTNGVVHLIDTVVIPESALYVSQALKSENFTKFQNLINKAGLADELDSLKNVTIFAPSDEAFDSPSTVKLLEQIKDDKEKLKDVVMYHTVQGKLESCDMNNNMLLKTENDKSVRLNLYSTLPLFTNIINRATVNCARLTGFDEKSCGSILHEVGQVLVPPSENLLEIINEDENYATLSELLKGTDLETILKDSTQSLTFLAPTNDAFSKMEPTELKKLMDDKKQASALLKNHILTEILCCSGVGSQAWGFNSLVPTLSYQPQSISKNRDKIYIGAATVTGCDKMATNGIVHTLDKVLLSQQSRTPGFGFFFFDY